MAQRPSYSEWRYWANVLVDRLTSVVHVYSKPPYDDVYIADIKKQPKVDYVIALIRRVHYLVDLGGISIDRALSEEEIGQKMVRRLTPLFLDILEKLPSISEDMQYLLKSPWFENCTGTIATEIFCGPNKTLGEGIGSGMIECGRLPFVLSNLIEREKAGDSREDNVSSEEETLSARRGASVRKFATSYGSAGRVD